MTNCVNKRNQKGFTLTELIIVIVIIGILAAVLIPSLSGYISKAKQSAAEQDALSMHKEYLATLDSDEYLEKSEANYIVLCNKYYVVIEKGALKSSFEEKELANNFEECNTPSSCAHTEHYYKLPAEQSNDLKVYSKKATA